MNADRVIQTRRSATWAAYGDALGFITELGDANRVLYRAGASSVDRTVPWRRKVGGRIGVTVDLPAGTYSDDTQLRLATSRAIRADGSFDVAAFAKVELPAWANYALGAGIGSKEAAASLSRTSATWYSNFFESKRASYFHGGGNGAAMRVQPHVWAAADLEDNSAILRDVVRNAICTHGHARGIVGACFHAATLAWTMKKMRPPSLEECEHIIDTLRAIPGVVNADGDLRLFWLGPWEEHSRLSLDRAIGETIDEMKMDVALLRETAAGEVGTAYGEAVERLDAKNPEVRGSGTKTALLASYLALLGRDQGPSNALVCAANCLGSDTDSIATMAGAILGVCSDVDCDDAIQDRQYIESEAKRLADVSLERPASSFRYPDLRSWKPARAAIDAVSVNDRGLSLNGIGRLKALEDRPQQQFNAETLQWFELSFGQTILARVRQAPMVVEDADLRSSTDLRPAAKASAEGGAASRLPDLFATKTERAVPRDSVGGASRSSGNTLNETLQKVIASGFDPDVIGQALLAQVRLGRPDFVERGIALTATILTAYEARTRKRK